MIGYLLERKLPFVIDEHERVIGIHTLRLMLLSGQREYAPNSVLPGQRGAKKASTKRRHHAVSHSLESSKSERIPLQLNATFS